MIRMLLTGILLAGGLQAQSKNILPLDWVDHSGILVINGYLFWNQDWTTGPLFFDGTYTAFPPRFGKAVTHRFQPRITGMTAPPILLSDSSTVSTFFDYRRGDHFLDQIEIGADFQSTQRRVLLRGFKRSYAGDHGQYLYPGISSTPIQQSYLVEYASRQGARRVEIGAGRFITRSGLPDSTINGRYNDDILTAGVHLQQPWNQMNLDVSFSQFLQQRRVLLSFQPDSTRHSLNRTHFQGQLNGPKRFGMGIESDLQTLVQDSSLQTYSWTTIFGQKQVGAFSLQLGYSFLGSNQRNQPFFRFLFYEIRKRFVLNGSAVYEHRPRHPRERKTNSEARYDSWLRGNFTIEFQGDRFKSAVEVGAGQNTAALSGWGKNYTSLMLTSQWEFSPGWFLEGEYMTQLDTSLYLIGWDQIINLGLRGSVTLFTGSLNLKGRIWGQGYLGPHSNFTFDPFDQVPLSPPPGRIITTDQWVLNFETQAVISSVIISYRIYNLLNSVSSVINGISESNRWFLANPYFPPLGRMVYFEVSWKFQN
ncbi:MAG: hypothetical protein ACE5D2_02640 [Fidelibacterota bacterium]